MNRKYRKTIIAGNWKMYKTPSEARAFLEELKAALPKTKKCSVALCLPYVDLPLATKVLKDSRIAVGAQNLHWASQGPYTGEVSAPMLADLDVKYVIIGHSERRSHFGESDLIVNKKIHAALDAGLHPILCVGEDFEQRELGVTLEFITYQLTAALSGVTPEQMKQVVIAYEPIWAIGTGTSATPQQAGEVCTAIRAVIRRLYGARLARATTIQYGGSMNETNAGALLAQEDIDGGLIGTASLRADTFLQIIEAAHEAAQTPQEERVPAQP
jgi:triosephosphate isomerase